MNINNPTTFGTPGLTLTTSNAEGTGDAIRTGASILTFDVTLPATASLDTDSATGSASTASRRDHVHGMVTSIPVANGGTGSTTASGARTALGLGTAAVADTGVANGDVIVADATGLPVIDGSQLTGLSFKQIEAGTTSLSGGGAPNTGSVTYGTAFSSTPVAVAAYQHALNFAVGMTISSVSTTACSIQGSYSDEVGVIATLAT